uniref:RNA1 polyprotein n=1 Tax=Broad bean wilt virus 1 TaxID=50817 RepID=A0A650AQH6_BBWV1|nr:polyprotein [Broad bean wilt virus 1]
MDSETIDMCVKFLKISFGLQSLKDLVKELFGNSELEKLAYVHAAFFHANEMAIHWNADLPWEEVMSSKRIKERFGYVKTHFLRNIVYNIDASGQMIRYNTTTCEQWFCCNFNLASYGASYPSLVPEEGSAMPTNEEAEIKIGQSLVTCAQSVTKAIYAKLSAFTTRSIQGFLECLRDAICGAFSSWLPCIKGAFAWFGNIIEVLKHWAGVVHEKLHNFLEGIEECLYMGLGLVASTCIVALIEKFLVTMSVISGPCGAPTLFLTSAMAIISSTYFLSKAVEKSSAFTMLLGFVTQSCQSVLSTLFGKTAKGSEEAQGQFGPSAMLESLAALVSSWSSSSVTEIGRTFGAISQIKNGILALKDMVLFVFGKLCEMASKILGFESQILADLSIILGENVADWLDECDCMLAYLLEFNSNARDIFDRLSQLIEKGKAIRMGILRTTHRGSSQVLSLVTKALDKLTELHNSVIMSGANSTRKTPFMLFFTGKSGVGKTSVVQRMAANWLQQEQLGPNEIYSRNGLDPFWSGYKRQAVVTYDDFGAVPGNVSNEAEIINVVSSNPHSVMMADLKEKGMYFDSRLIIASSNFLAANPESGVHDSEAYERRRHVVVQVSLKEDVAYDPGNPCANQRYTLLDSKAPFAERAVFESYEELWSHVYNAFKAHEERERLFLASLPIPERNEKEALQALIGICVMTTSYAPKAVIQYGIEHLAGYHYLISSAEHVYFWHEKGEVEIVPMHLLKLDKMDRATMASTSLKSALMCQDMAKNFPTLNPLAVLYAKNIVIRGWVDANLQASKKCEDSYMREQIESLPKWQRAYLHVLSGHIASNEARGWFLNCLDTTKKNLRNSYIWEYKSWPMPLKLALGSFLAILAGSAIFCSLQSLWSVSGNASFVAGAASIFTIGSATAQSAPPNKDGSEYTYRNKKIRVRNWEGQSPCFGDSALWIAENCMASLVVMQNRVQVCMAPGRSFLGVNHFLRMIPNGVMVKLETGTAETYFVWERAKLKLFENSEIALYTSANLPKAPDSLVDRFHFDLETLPKTFPAQFFTYKFDKDTQQYVPELGELMCKKAERALCVVSGEYRRVISHHLVYKNPTVAGDCGGLVLANIEGKCRLVGLHVASDGEEGAASPIPWDPDFKVAQGQSDFLLNYEEWAIPKILGPGCKAVGIIAPEHTVGSGGKTSFLETPIEWQLNKPCGKIPSILVKGDVRLAGTENADYDPFAVGMTKYAKEAGPFEPKGLDKVCESIVETWHDASDGFEFGPVDLEAALNGIENMEYFDALVLSTSEGYPYRLDRKPGEKGKARYVEGEPGSMEITDERILADIHWFEEISKVQVPDLYCIECVKDERLPVRKVLKEPKSRLFTVLPMSYNLAIRKKFLNFVRFIMKRRDVLPCQVGVNPYSRQWGKIADRLLEKGNSILCCDYSRFDGFLPKCIMVKIAEMFSDIVGESEVEREQTKNLMLACCSRYAICGRVLYRVENGIPSGFPLTVIVNSILNEILIKYAYWKCFEEESLIRDHFNTYVAMVVYGDDNLISVSEVISSRFNGNFLVNFMSNLGIKVTDGVDKTKVGIDFRTIEDCDFLKRKFKENTDGTWSGVMAEEHLWPQLHFVKAKKVEMSEAYISNCNNILRELWLGSPEKAAAFRREVISKLKWIEPQRLLTVSQVALFHSEQMNGELPFVEACHQLENLELMAPLEPGMLPVKTQEIMPGLFVASEKNFTGNFDDYFTISITTNRKFADGKGFQIIFPYGAGRGGLPSKAFMEQNVIRKGCAIQKAFKQGLEKGNKMLFISQSSVIPAYVFAIMLYRSIDRLPRALSNKALTSALGICKKLSYLPKDFPDLF